MSSQVPSTSDTPSHVLPPISLHHSQHVFTNSSAGTNTLLSRTPEAPSSLMVPQSLSEIVDPPLHRSTHVSKSTKSQDFAYSCYSSSFTSFLAYIHFFFLSLFPIKRLFLIHVGNELWMRNFLLCIRQVRIWVLYLLVRVLLVVVGCIRLRLILMDLLSDSKLGWLQKDIHNSTIWIMRRLLLLLRK